MDNNNKAAIGNIPKGFNAWELHLDRQAKRRRAARQVIRQELRRKGLLRKVTS